MHKFFVDKSQIDGEDIYIEGQDVKHIRDVLRLKPGQEIIVSSDGYNYLANLRELGKTRISLDIRSKEKGESESQVEIVLYQALAKGSKMDLIIQKNTEIGVKEFVGVMTHRTLVKIKDVKKEKNKIDRWNMIAEEAAKQSKRDFIPSLARIETFDQMVDSLRGEVNIIVPYEDEEGLSLGQALKPLEGSRVNLVIGPEGGFEEEEIQRLKELGAQVVSLGKRILRTETAGFVASTIILYELGGLGVI